MGNGFVETDTTYGRLRGVRFRGIDSYLGIPYGASTAGNGRFAPPRAPEAWSGVREAMWFGDAAPQVDTRVGSAGDAQNVHNLMYVKGGHPLDGTRMSEDCLNLNVWTPSSNDGVARPVMVWFHGGGFAHGSAGSALYNGDQLAALGDVVVVTVNARLGLHGFLPLEFIAEEFAGAANAGMLDLVAALEWVRDNIAGFGGNPGNVTVFGQSGGGGKVNTLMAMPAAQGLFHKAINMSGPILSAVEPTEAAASVTRVMKEAGLDASAAAELRNLPMRDVLEIQRTLSASLAAPFGMGHGESSGEIAIGFAPVLDGVHVTDHPFSAGALPAADSIPMLVGWAAHDPSLLMCASTDFAGLTDDEARQRARENYGERGVELFSQYTADFPDEASRLRYARVVNAFTFRAAGLAIAEAKAEQSAPVYVYEFAHPTSILDGLLGTTHSLDLPFVFANVNRSVFAGELPTRHETSRSMALAWIAFARNGNPNHDSIPQWAPFDAETRIAMQIGAEWTSVAQPSVTELTTGRALVS
jgi:para-nitrobenzyl esterase